MPSTGVINLAGTSSPISVAQELNLGLTTAISMNDASVRTLAGAGGSGTSWSMLSLYGKSNRVTVNIVVNSGTSTTNYIASVSTVPGYIAGKTDATFTINSGQVIGSTSAGSWAFTVDTSWNASDSVAIVNNGIIKGAGGAGSAGRSISGGGKGVPAVGPATPGGGGGPAFRALRSISVTNNGTIGGGGGGGGGGGASAMYISGTNTITPHWNILASGAGGGAGAGANTAQYNNTAGGGYTYALTGKGTSYYGAGGSGGGVGSAGGTGAAGYDWTSTINAPCGGGAGGQAVGGNSFIVWNATGTRYGGIS